VGPTDGELALAASCDRSAVAVIYGRYAEPRPRLLLGELADRYPSSSS
jgi:hypothetical protein